MVAPSGGSAGIRDRGPLEAALYRPLAAFSGQELFPSVRNHPFVDGNKRMAAVLMITLLRLHGLDLVADDDRAEEALVGLASGSIDLDTFTGWVLRNTVPNDRL